MASRVDRGSTSPPAPSAGFSGVCAAIATESACESTSVSCRVAGRPMHIVLSRPGRTREQTFSESMLRVKSSVAKSTALHAPELFRIQQWPVKSVRLYGWSRRKAYARHSWLLVPFWSIEIASQRLSHDSCERPGMPLSPARFCRRCSESSFRSVAAYSLRTISRRPPPVTSLIAVLSSLVASERMERRTGWVSPNSAIIASTSVNALTARVWYASASDGVASSGMVVSPL